MLTLGSLAFVHPWMLLALTGLPLLWWLLRLIPPAPKRLVFPPVRILAELLHREETPVRTPPWLLLLRLALAAIVIIATAHPIVDPGVSRGGGGPLVVVFDDGWAAAPRWQRRLDALERLLDQADRDGRAVALVRTAPPASGQPMTAHLRTAAETRNTIHGLAPSPWPTDRRAALEALRGLDLTSPVESVWLTDGLASPSNAGDAGEALAGYLLSLGPLQLLEDPAADERAHALLPPAIHPDGFELQVLRNAAAGGGGQASLWIRAVADNGAVLGRQEVRFAASEATAKGLMTLPLEVRNRATRLIIEDEAGAGATVLLDERWRRRPVGVVSGESLDQAQPLLAATYYVERALAPFSEVRKAPLADLLARDLAVAILADVGQVVGPDRQRLGDWVEHGGVLVRFAGPRMAEATDDLIPVRLRGGGRVLGGALSWTKPAHLAKFDANSPFHGLTVPDDAVVNRQVLAEPTLDLAAKTWSRLEDGTPLVTAERRGQGWVVLIHTTADATWTNLPLSGLFVDMLRRLIDLSQGTAGGPETGMLPPFRVLDGLGHLEEPGPVARPIAASRLNDGAVGPRYPAGFYGTGDARHARNLTAAMTALPPLNGLPSSVSRQDYGEGHARDLRPLLLLAAVVLALADLVAALALKGLLAGPGVARFGRIAGALLIGAVATSSQPSPAAAQDKSPNDAYALEASLETRLAYVVTGDREADAMSHAGLVGLSQALTNRTAVEPAPPFGVDIARDEIVFFPLLYWPIVAGQGDLSDAVLAKLDHYMKNGGTILFDTRDQGMTAPGGSGPNADHLRRLLRRLDIPPLVPIPQDHVLTKAFYLMQSFPGRWTGGEVWVEGRGGGGNDGVSAIVIGSHDWAAAWAIDDQGRALAAVVPGGELQREQSYRFGINLVMYALTGNYKADQVHVPALLERLGQ